MSRSRKWLMSCAVWSRLTVHSRTKTKSWAESVNSKPKRSSNVIRSSSKSNPNWARWTARITNCSTKSTTCGRRMTLWNMRNVPCYRNFNRLSTASRNWMKLTNRCEHVSNKYKVNCTKYKRNLSLWRTHTRNWLNAKKNTRQTLKSCARKSKKLKRNLLTRSDALVNSNHWLINKTTRSRIWNVLWTNWNNNSANQKSKKIDSATKTTSSNKSSSRSPTVSRNSRSSCVRWNKRRPIWKRKFQDWNNRLPGLRMKSARWPNRRMSSRSTWTISEEKSCHWRNTSSNSKAKPKNNNESSILSVLRSHERNEWSRNSKANTENWKLKSKHWEVNCSRNTLSSRISKKRNDLWRSPSTTTATVSPCSNRESKRSLSRKRKSRRIITPLSTNATSWKHNASCWLERKVNFDTIWIDISAISKKKKKPSLR